MAPRRRVRLRSVALAAAGGATGAARARTGSGRAPRARAASPALPPFPRTFRARLVRACAVASAKDSHAVGVSRRICAPPACAASAALVACALLASSRARAISDVIVPMGDLPPGAGVNKATRELIDAAVNGADAPAGVAR